MMFFQRHREIEPSYDLDRDLLEHYRWRATRSGESISSGFVHKFDLLSDPFQYCLDKWYGKLVFVILSVWTLYSAAVKIQTLNMCGFSAGCSVLSNVTDMRVLGYVAIDGLGSSINNAILSIDLRNEGCTIFRKARGIHPNLQNCHPPCTEQLAAHYIHQNDTSH